MARLVTLSSLEAQVRQRSDAESLTQRFSSAEVTEYINGSYAELYNYLLQSGQEFYLSSYSFNTSAGVADYALPSDFFLDKGADTTINGQLFTLDRWFFEEREKYDIQVTWSPGMPLAYSILGSNISIRPTPGGVFTIKLWYYPTPTRLVSGTDTIDCMSGFEEYIAADAAIKILAKDDRDSSEQLRQKKAAKYVIDMMISNRSRSNPNRVRRIWKKRRTYLKAIA